MILLAGATPMDIEALAIVPRVSRLGTAACRISLGQGRRDDIVSPWSVSWQEQKSDARVGECLILH
jgi:hypothetical protein